MQSFPTSFQEAITPIDQEYSFLSLRARVNIYLSSLLLSSFVNEILGLSVALAKVYKLILKLSRQVPASHRIDVQCIELLGRLVIEYT